MSKKTVRENPPVTEARPIRLDQLADFELEVVKEINARLYSISESNRTDLRGSLPDRREIDHHHSGRLLFIDGDRGAGKTSLLLTLLTHWSRADPIFRSKAASLGRTEAALRSESGFAELDGKCVVFRPPLDFDPLPERLPVHGWLLHPWLSIARCFDKDRAQRGASQEFDFVEQWHALFELAVVGWTAAALAGKGFVERTIEYQNQTTGWSDLPVRWNDFVNAATERFERNQEESPLFIVAIDDVDLQVERIPSLIHALRLLRHPRVVYVVTGDRSHLHEVLEADYRRRHREVSGGRFDPYLGRGYDPDEWRTQPSLDEKMEWSSRGLANALVEKALPERATFRVRKLTVAEILALDMGTYVPACGRDLDQAPVTVSRLVDHLTHSAVAGGAAPDLGLVQKVIGNDEVATFRNIQSAFDLLKGPEGEHPSAVMNVIARLISDDFKGRAGSDSVNDRGKLRTARSIVKHSWGAISVGGEPRLELVDEDNVNAPVSRDYSHIARARRLLVLSEQHLLRTPFLDWEPFGGPIWSVSAWPQSSGPVWPVSSWPSSFGPVWTVSSLQTSRGHAVRSSVSLRVRIDWPWLKKPSPTSLDAYFGDFERRALTLLTSEGQVSKDVNLVSLVLGGIWIQHNLHHARLIGDEVVDIKPILTASDAQVFLDEQTRMCRLKLSDGGVTEEQKVELSQWMVQLLILCRGYMGLDTHARRAFGKMVSDARAEIERRVLSESGLPRSLLDEFRAQERSIVETAAVSEGLDDDLDAKVEMFIKHKDDVWSEIMSGMASG